MISHTFPTVSQDKKINLGNHSPVFIIATCLYFFLSSSGLAIYQNELNSQLHQHKPQRCSANQKTSFYMKHNTGLNWIKVAEFAGDMHGHTKDLF